MPTHSPGSASWPPPLPRLTAKNAADKTIWLSLSETADRLGVRPQTVSHAAKRGALPVVRVGRSRLVPAVVVTRLQENPSLVFPYFASRVTRVVRVAARPPAPPPGP